MRGGGLSGMVLVENLAPQTTRQAAMAMHWTTSYKYTDAALFPMNRDAFWKLAQLLEEMGGNTWHQGISPGYEP